MILVDFVGFFMMSLCQIRQISFNVVGKPRGHSMGPYEVWGLSL